jgi:hypothetical protein
MQNDSFRQPLQTRLPYSNHGSTTAIVQEAGQDIEQEIEANNITNGSSNYSGETYDNIRFVEEQKSGESYEDVA